MILANNGLRNYGSTCFINTWIQNMGSSQRVLGLLMESYDRFPSSVALDYEDVDEQFFVELRETVFNLRTPNMMGNIEIDGGLIGYIYHKMGAPFNTQQDICEFLGALMGILQNVYPPLYSAFAFRTKDKCSSATYTVTQYNFYISSDEYRFDLVKELKRKVTVSCDRNCSDKTHFLDTPACLLLALYKYSEAYQVRNDVAVMFPMSFSLGSATYQLVAVSNYMGMDGKGGGAGSSKPKKASAKKAITDNCQVVFDTFASQSPYTGTCGHYYAFGRRSRDWFVFDDSRVEPTTHIISNNAYVLFYEKCA